MRLVRYFFEKLLDAVGRRMSGACCFTFIRSSQLFVLARRRYHSCRERQGIPPSAANVSVFGQ